MCSLANAKTICKGQFGSMCIFLLNNPVHRPCSTPRLCSITLLEHGPCSTNFPLACSPQSLRSTHALNLRCCCQIYHPQTMHSCLQPMDCAESCSPVPLHQHPIAPPSPGQGAEAQNRAPIVTQKGVFGMCVFCWGSVFQMLVCRGGDKLWTGGFGWLWSGGCG